MKIGFCRLALLFYIVLRCQTAQSQDIGSLKDTFKVSGSVGLRGIAYRAGGIDNRRTPFSYVLNGNLTLSKGAFSIPLSFTYSEQDRSVSQPFNQFGIAPSYKWLKIYAGYNNVSWSNYTMNGHQILGGGFELTPKKLRLGFMYGRLHRQSDIDSNLYNNYLPTFLRTGLTAKIGYGKDNNFIDLVWFRGKDQAKGDIRFYNDTNIIVHPADNNVLGIKTRKQLGKHLQFYLDGGISAYNRDIYALEVPFEGLTGIAGAAVSALRPTISMNIYSAIETGLQINAAGQQIGLQFKRVDPDYKSMGSYFIENDLQSFMLNHATSFWKGKISLQYSIERYTDNLQNKKEFTTTRYQPNVNIGFNPSTFWGLSANWSNLYTSQRDGSIVLSDTVRMKQSNPGITISPYLNFGDTSYYHVISTNYTNMRLIDFNRFTAGFSQYTTQVLNVQYMLSVLSKQTGFLLGANRTANQTQAFDEKGFGVSLGFNQSFAQGKSSAQAAINGQFSDVNNTFSLNSGYNRTFKHQQSASANLNWMLNRAKILQGRDYNELTFLITYQKNF